MNVSSTQLGGSNVQIGCKLFTLVILLSMFAGVGIYHSLQMFGVMNVIVPNSEAQEPVYHAPPSAHRR